MKKLLLSLTMFFTAIQMTAGVNDTQYIVKINKKVADLSIMGTTAAFAYWQLYNATEAFSAIADSSELRSPRLTAYLTASEVTPCVIAYLVASQVTTAMAAKAFSESLVRRTSHLDRNLALNVVEAAF